MDEHAIEHEAASDPIGDTRRWLERAVIGLNLCPFAKAVHAKGQVRYVLSDADTPQALLEELGASPTRSRYVCSSASSTRR